MLSTLGLLTSSFALLALRLWDMRPSSARIFFLVQGHCAGETDQWADKVILGVGKVMMMMKGIKRMMMMGLKKIVASLFFSPNVFSLLPNAHQSRK